MTAAPRSQPWLAAAAVLAVGAVVVLAGFRSLTRERRFSPDSRNYINAAENLLRGRGLAQDAVGLGAARIPLRFEVPQPLCVHPPGYPLAIAAVSGLGVEPSDAALLVAIAAYPAILALAFALMRRLYDLSTACWAAVLLLVSAPLRQITTVAWAESLALALLLASLWVALRREPQQTGVLDWLAAGLLAGLAFGTRYPLLVGLPIGVLLAFRRGEALPSLRRASHFCLGFSLVAGPIVLRNLTRTGFLTGNERNPSTIPLLDNVVVSVKVLLGEVVASGGGPLGRALQAGLLAALLVALLWRTRGSGAGPRLAALFLAPRRRALVLWLAAYSLFLIAQRSRVSFDALNARLLSPAHLFLMLLAAVALGTLLPQSPRLGAALVLLASLGPAAEHAHALATREPVHMARPAGPSARRRWVKTHVTERDLIVGQRCGDLAFLQGRPCLYFSRYPEMLPVTWADLLAIRGEACGRYENVYLLLFKEDADEARWARDYGPFIADLAYGRLSGYPGITELARLEDGSAFGVACPGRLLDAAAPPP